MTSVARIGEWGRARRLLTGATARFERAVQRSLRTEAERVRDAIREGLERQAPGGHGLEPLAPMTLAARSLAGQRSTKALIERGELLRGIVDDVRGDRAFVGIRRRARSRDGRALMAIADLQERGGRVRVRMTPAMRRFLFAAAALAGRRNAGIRRAGAVQIPARPFLQPAFALATRDARPRWARSLARSLGWRR